MMPQPPDPGFFIGYSKKVPPVIAQCALLFGVFLFLGLVSASLAFSLSTPNPGSGGYVDELRGGHLTGVLETLPYPILRVPAQDGQSPRAIMLSGQGKAGVTNQADPLNGQWAAVSGIFVKRGALDMLLVGGKPGLVSTEPPAGASQPNAPVSLGRWRLTGEICDGKCYAGAMRPGTGLAHKACANLCITGGVPPVFVTTSPVEGHNFLLMAGSDGGPLPREMLDQTGLLIELEGEVEQRDDLLIFRVELPTARGANS